MYDPHPFLSAFPIVLHVVAILVLILGCVRAGKCGAPEKQTFDHILSFLTVTAALFSIIAFVSGYFAAGYTALEVDTEMSERVAFHHLVGRAGMVLSLICASFRAAVILAAPTQRRVWNSLCIVFLILATTALCYGGYLGGQLVFAYGAGVSGM